MNTQSLVLYDSAFGNTAKIAEAIASGLGTRVVMAKDVPQETLRGLRLLVLGSPTQGGTMTPYLQQYCKDMPAGLLQGVRIAAFDTRLEEHKQNAGLKMLMRVIGYAAPKISSKLISKGAGLVADPVGFIVSGKEGPLKDGELDRAHVWGESLRRS